MLTLLHSVIDSEEQEKYLFLSLHGNSENSLLTVRAPPGSSQFFGQFFYYNNNGTCLIVISTDFSHRLYGRTGLPPKVFIGVVSPPLKTS